MKTTLLCVECIVKYNNESFQRQIICEDHTRLQFQKHSSSVRPYGRGWHDFCGYRNSLSHKISIISHLANNSAIIQLLFLEFFFSYRCSLIKTLHPSSTLAKMIIVDQLIRCSFLFMFVIRHQKLSVANISSLYWLFIYGKDACDNTYSL